MAVSACNRDTKIAYYRQQIRNGLKKSDYTTGSVAENICYSIHFWYGAFRKHYKHI